MFKKSPNSGSHHIVNTDIYDFKVKVHLLMQRTKYTMASKTFRPSFALHKLKPDLKNHL